MNKISVATLATIFTLISAIVLAQSSGGNYSISISTIDNGGGVSSGGEYSITGSIGQHDAGLHTSGNGEYLLAGGFWAKATDVIFGNGFESN